MSRASVARWVDAIRPGDVVRFKSSALRTVLAVSHRPDGRLHSAHFAIKVCSWTHRAHTVIGRSDLLGRLDCPTQARVRLDQFEGSRRILEELARLRTARTSADMVPSVTCCDVIGVFE